MQFVILHVKRTALSSIVFLYRAEKSCGLHALLERGEWVCCSALLLLSAKLNEQKRSINDIYLCTVSLAHGGPHDSMLQVLFHNHNYFI